MRKLREAKKPELNKFQRKTFKFDLSPQPFYRTNCLNLIKKLSYRQNNKIIYSKFKILCFSEYLDAKKFNVRMI